MHYKIGTRGSKLALTQTKYVKTRLEKAYPGDSFELVVIETKGDKNQVTALDAIGSKGLFTFEIEQALLNGEIALAVHSMKDMPDQVARGLTFAKAWEREDPRDALILKEAKSLEDLPKGACIGTGSKRRVYQLKQQRPDLNIVGIRGNVDTRIKKLMDPANGLDGIVLAAAGLKRLGREGEITQYLSTEQMIPAPAQGILAIELAETNRELLDKINALSDPSTQRAMELERGFLSAIGGDCHMPIAAYFDGKYFLSFFGTEDGSRLAKSVIDCGDCLMEQKELANRAVEDIQSQLKKGEN